MTGRNRKLSAINAFCCFHARHGVDVGELLVTWQAPGRGGGRGGYRPFLHHITKCSPQPRRTVALKGAKKLPRILTPAEVQAVLDACVHLRDRFLFALLYDSGVRIGEALGLRHEDIDAASRVLRVEPRTNSNGARVKNHSERSVPISGQLVRLWGDYLQRVRRPRLRLRVREPVRGPARAGDDLLGGLRPGGAASRAGRVRLRSALAPSLHGHEGASGRGAARGGLRAARPLLDHRHRTGLWPPDRRGRPQGA